jgi:hypothetical protein
MRDPEKVRSARQRYRASETNRETEREGHRRYREANRDKIRAARLAYEAANREKIRAKAAAYRAANRELARDQALWRMHRMRPDQWSALYLTQGGCCYLCGDQLDPEKVDIDHDHRCCPRNSSCPNCRRGLTCRGCNRAIGLAKDDPARLRRMADRLETAQKRVSDRLFEVKS